MPVHLGSVEIEAEYTLYYQKGKETVLAAAPTKADAEDMFEWIAKKVGLIT